MKRMQAWRGLAAALLLGAGATAGRAEAFAIQSFGGNGQMVFDAVPEATNYEVRVATALTGDWNMAGSVAPSSASMLTTTVAVAGSMGFVRVVAHTNVPPSGPSGMVQIPGGTNSGTDPDFGAYSLTVEAFYMDRYEVTKALWDDIYAWAVVHGYSFDNAGSGKATNHPVHTVNWYDCVKWCNARSQKEGRSAVYTVDGAVYKTGRSDNVVQTSATGYRLPTKTEWEYAARGGQSGRRFPWGDTINHDNANYRANGSGYTYDTSPYTILTYHPTYNDGITPYTSPVGAFAANGYGLYDMVGNVWEWCYDALNAYRCIRGGNWYFSAYFARCGNSDWYGPLYNYTYFGFRAVCR